GQRITIDCLAQRIDSRMEPAISVLSASGRPLATARDPMAVDATLIFEAPEEGEYVIVVNDFVFAGGGEHFYRLAIDTSPHIDYVFPPAGEPGQPRSFALYGRNLPGGKPVEGMTV